MRTRIAVIGAGLIGRKHLGILKDDPAFEVAGMADPAPQAAAFARENGFPHFANTEALLDGTKPDGVVTEEQFIQFVDEYVTPRFPDGLTLLKGDGQFRGESRVIVKEQSFVLVLLYPYEALADGSRRIERIRTLYKRLFAQESVLRVADPFIVWVTF